MVEGVGEVALSAIQKLGSANFTKTDNPITCAVFALEEYHGKRFAHLRWRAP